jgi:methyl-CpG-binding domain protein 4
MIPPRTPFCLIQEDLWPDEYKILVACMMLNCTSRKQVDRVLPEFFRRWPTPQALLAADKEDVAELIAPLGFMRRRTANIFKMSERYIAGPWAHASELPGIGQYGWRSWEIFCMGHLGDKEPTDHALVKAWRWMKERDGNEKALHREKEEGCGSVRSSSEEG